MKTAKEKNQEINNIQKENLECAIACALAMKIKINNIIKTLDKLKSASGRFEEIIYKKKSSKIIIDYAHTPDAMQNVLKSYTNKSLNQDLIPTLDIKVSLSFFAEVPFS